MASEFLDIPGNIKQMYLPFVVNNDNGLCNSPIQFTKSDTADRAITIEDEVNTQPQLFTYKYGSSAPYTGHIQIAPRSVYDRRIEASNDISYELLYSAKTYTKSSTQYHVFPGDVIPAGVEIEIGEGYTVDADIICKIVVKLPPFMSAFEVGTSFFNPRSLTENHYLTFGHNTLVALKNYPFVTLRASAE